MKPYPPLFARLRPTLSIAHRGGAALAPENTLAAFGSALERWRADMLELDVHFSRDGVAFVSHDPTVDRCTDGTGAIAELYSSELSRFDAGFRFTPDDGKTHPFRGKGCRLPTFEQLLAAFPSVPLNVDLKVESIAAADAFAEELRRLRAVDRVCVGAEWDPIAARLAERLPGGCVFYPREALTAFILHVRQGEPPPDDERFQVLDMPLFMESERLIDDALLRAARERGKWINVWTVDDAAEMKRLGAEGVGGIMTDRPDLLRGALDRT